MHWERRNDSIYAWKIFFIEKNVFFLPSIAKNFLKCVHVEYQHVIAIAMVLNQAFFKPILANTCP